MELILDDKYRLTSDPNNIVLEQKTVRKEGKQSGKEVWTAVAYYPNISQALNGYTERRQRLSKTKSWNGIEKLLKSLHTSLNNISQRLKVVSK